MIDRLLLLGATGDLAGRFLLPALAELQDVGELPDRFEIIAVAHEKLDIGGFRAAAEKRLATHAPDVRAGVRRALLDRMRFHSLDLAAPQAGRAICAALARSDGAPDDRPVAAYLALPPGLFAPAVTALGDAGLPRGSRVVLEKPFAESLDGAVALNRLLARVVGDERSVFRVDHALGMATVYNLLGLRLANRIIDPIWCSDHIEQVDILWEETLALEGRAGYYDKSGALKDVLQNHMMQILCLVAMEPPATAEGDELRDRKVEVLRNVCPPTREQMATRTNRARYTAGTLAGTGGASRREVPDYAAEPGVDPSRETETYAEVVLTIDCDRWRGTRFVMRAGKALHRRWKGVIVRFRPVPKLPFKGQLRFPERNELRIGLDGPENLSVHLTGSAPGSPPELTPLVMNAQLPAAELRAYGNVLREVLSGESSLSISGDEAEEAWRIVTPILRAWREGVVPLREYAAGSAGPRSLTEVTTLLETSV
jgi:glucose-6-phosphate 1-dehydrogenase